jgi:multiple sugar transport system ATP-binding protein
MRAELSKLHDRLRTTIIYVTHDQVEAMTMGSKIVVMKDGLIQQIGAPLEIYNRPLNLFVAGFIGSPVMNFIPCRVFSCDGRRGLDGGTFQVPLPEGCFAGDLLPDGAEVILGIRPNDIHERSAAPERLAQEPFRALIEVVEPLGSEIHITVAAGGQGLIARVPAETPVRVHQEIELVLDAERIHLFAKEPPHERLAASAS